MCILKLVNYQASNFFKMGHLGNSTFMKSHFNILSL